MALKTRIRRSARIFIFLLLGLVLLWLITRGQDIDLIVDEFRNARYGWIILAMACALLSHFLRAVRWNRLISAMGYRTSPVRTFYAVMTGYLANLAVPRMGEVTRCITLSKASGTPFNALAGTVLAERGFDMISMMSVVAITILTQFSFLRSFLHRIFWGPLLRLASDHWLLAGSLALGTAIVAVIAFIWIRRKTRNPREGSFFDRMNRQMKGLWHGMRTIGTMRGKGWFMLLSLLIWGLYFLMVYLCFFAIGGTSHLSPLAGLTLLAVGSLGILAPVPGGLGTYHFLTIIALRELYGVASEPATSYAYISHAAQVVVNVVAGSISWVMLSVISKAGVRPGVRHPAAPEEKQ